MPLECSNFYIKLSLKRPSASAPVSQQQDLNAKINKSMFFIDYTKISLKRPSASAPVSKQPDLNAQMNKRHVLKIELELAVGVYEFLHQTLTEATECKCQKLIKACFLSTLH